ncbi:MAG: hypothetical protein WA726_01420 [Acidimicrobiia bacterium]
MSTITRRQLIAGKWGSGEDTGQPVAAYRSRIIPSGLGTVGLGVSDSDPVPTTSTTIAPQTPPPTDSPLIRWAAGLAVIATGMAAWRANRMKGN